MNIKKIVPAAALMLACAALSGCGGSGSSGGASAASSAASAAEENLADKTAALRSSLEGKLPEMVNIKADTLKDRYGIESDDVADFSAYICGSGAMPDEFGIFRAKDADAAARVAEKLNKRVEQQRNTFKDYTPAEMYKFDDCFVNTSGTVVSYAICADNPKAKELLK